MKQYYLGIDIGGTHIKWVLMDQEDHIVEKDSRPTEDLENSSMRWRESVKEIVLEIEQSFGIEQINLPCGISAPGLTNNNNTVINFMPGRLQGLENYDWGKELGRSVFVINDAQSACLAEYQMHYKDQVQNMIMITLGTGVGGGVILNGELYQGYLNRAGHFGHITINYSGNPTATNAVGSLEEAIGNYSIGKRTLGKYHSTLDLVQAVKKNNYTATYWWLESMQKLACGLVSLNNALSPELIVIGGGIANADELLFDPLNEFMSLYEWSPNHQKVKVKKAKFQEYAGAMGAAILIKNKLNKCHTLNHI